MAGDPDALLRIRVNDVEHLKAVVNQPAPHRPRHRHEDADGARSLGSLTGGAAVRDAAYGSALARGGITEAAFMLALARLVRGQRVV